MQPTEELPVKINHGPHGCHTCQGKFMSKENKGSPSKNYKILVHFILTLIFPHLNDLKKIEWGRSLLKTCLIVLATTQAKPHTIESLVQRDLAYGQGPHK